MKTPGFLRSLLFAGILLALLTGLVREAAAASLHVGVVLTARVPFYQSVHAALLDTVEKSKDRRLRQLKFLVQRPAADIMAWHNAARKLIVYEADFLITYGGGATLTALEETDEIPVIFGAVFDPEAIGVGGKNVTGVSSRIPLSTTLENLQRIADVRKLGVIYNPEEVSSVVQTRQIESRQKNLDFEVVSMNLRDKNLLDRFEQVDGLFLSTSALAMTRLGPLLRRADQLHIPTATVLGGATDYGVVLCSSADAAEQGRLLAETLAQVLSGTPPRSVPVRYPHRLTMEINLREAKENGYKIPFDMLISATRVVK